jgi:hypothetical protein
MAGKADKEVVTGGADAIGAQPHQEVSGANWSILTRTNYGEWAVTMKVNLRARRLWKAIYIDQGTEDEEEDCSAMEAILASVP